MNGRLTVLGSGTSTGVPTLGCTCAVCKSRDPRDQRLRPSVLLRFDTQNVLFDTTPDFRTQALRAGLASLEAVFYTHGHADHIMGMDDIRPYNFRRAEPIPVYGDERTISDLKRVFKYVFEGEYHLSAIPQIAAHVLDGPVELAGVKFVPLKLFHGPLPITGYRFGNHAYLTDFSTIPDETMAELQGLDVMILDALRHRPHPTHSSVENSIEIVRKLQPRRAFFTHMCHELPHAETEAALPAPIHLAYDGLEIEVEL
jgi:phosphoribosyl 1,2-cyclic phosphate phosphodiesterase